MVLSFVFKNILRNYYHIYLPILIPKQCVVQKCYASVLFYIMNIPTVLTVEVSVRGQSGFHCNVYISYL